MPNTTRFVSSQPQYSLLWRQPEQKIIPLCADKGISQIVWSPLAQGVLSGKYLPGTKPPTRHAPLARAWANLSNRGCSQGFLRRSKSSNRSPRKQVARSLNSRWRGCCASKMSRRPSWAQADRNS